MRSLVFCIALLTATTAAAQSQPRLEIGNRQGNYYWVVETAPDGSRRGGWVSVNVPIDAIDRNALKPLPSALAAVGTPTQAPPPPPSIDERLARIEQSLAGNQTVRQEPQAVRSAPSPQVSQPRPDVVTPSTVGHSQTREGFWFNGGLGYGSLGCDNCIDRLNGLSGGLSLGGTLSDRVLLGVGTTGFAKSEFGDMLTVGTFDARLRFYPARESGFFLTGGLGVASVSVNDDSEYGLGLVLGLGWDIRVASNVSITPFWNGFAMRSHVADANVGQLGIGITIH